MAMNLRQALRHYECDKATHGYDTIYVDRLFDGMHLLEVGVFSGASLRTWLMQYPHSRFTVIDTFERVKPEDIRELKAPDVTWHKCYSQVITLEEEYDIIIDDGCHTHKCQLETFNNLFPYLKKGGYYFIEDVWPFDKMSDTEKQHDWLKGKADYSDVLYSELLAKIQQYDREFHDLRRYSGKPDSFLIEVVK